MTWKPDICIFHHPCDDGFGAAFAVWKKWFNEPLYMPYRHGEIAPDVSAKHVLIVDFSFKAEVIEKMARRAKSIVILDHHITALNDLKNWLVDDTLITADNVESHFTEQNLKCVSSVDMNRSGAMMAWRFCHKDMSVPKLIEHIQDMDLWRFELEGTRAFSMCLRSYPYDFDVWDQLVNTDPNELIREGTIIERFLDRKISEIVRLAIEMDMGGYTVPAVNAPPFMASDVAHELAKGRPFAAAWHDGPQGRIFSLRSTDEGVDVSEIARRYGGGGHKHAAGFQVPHPPA